MGAPWTNISIGKVLPRLNSTVHLKYWESGKFKTHDMSQKQSKGIQ